MTKFRKIQKEIDAVQLNAHSVLEVYEFTHNERPDLYNSINAGKWFDYVYHVIDNGFTIKTIEGDLVAKMGDWILKGESKDQGVHFWPVKPDYFKENYEQVE